jgi:hypothetical protein
VLFELAPNIFESSFALHFQEAIFLDGNEKLVGTIPTELFSLSMLSKTSRLKNICLKFSIVR